MSHIRNTDTGGVAFTATNAPGFEEKRPATDEQLAAHAKVMNERAKELGIKARYEVVA